MKLGYLCVALLSVLLVACGKQDEAPQKTTTAETPASPVKTAPAAPANKPVANTHSASQFKPEMVVRFPHSSIACLTKEGLLEITMHALQGEQTKAAAMMLSNDNTNGQCIMLSPKQKVKIISVEYNNPDTPDLGILEVVGQHTVSSQGAWVYSAGAVQAKKSSATTRSIRRR